MRLKRVPGDSTRPIMDRVKESLFNIIGWDIHGIRCLDMFAGTGSVGIECLSRGAEHCLFLDLHPAAIKTINENLQTTRLHDKATVLQTNAIEFVAKPPKQPFDLVYIAPPQYKKLWLDALRAVDNNPKLLADADAQVIVQIDPVELEDITLTNLQEKDRRKYGSTVLLFYVQAAATLK